MGYEYLEQVHLLFAHADFMIYVNAVSLQNCFGFHSLDNWYIVLYQTQSWLFEVWHWPAILVSGFTSLTAKLGDLNGHLIHSPLLGPTVYGIETKNFKNRPYQKFAMICTFCGPNHQSVVVD